MRYFDEDLLANSAQHRDWWDTVVVNREYFHHTEAGFAAFQARTLGTNASAILPRDAWIEFDNETARVLRDDGGDVFMQDILPLAKAVSIGKLAHLTRIASDSINPVNRSISGQIPTLRGKVVYDYRGTPVPIFSDGFGREWREWNTQKSENFDALSDDHEGSLDKLNRDMADYALNGDASIQVQGYVGYGLLNNPLTKLINLGAGAGGANIDLTTATPDQLDAFFSQTLGKVLDDNLVTDQVILYISKEIARAWDKQYSGSAGFKTGRIIEFLKTYRRFKDIKVTAKLTGNAFFGFVPKAKYVRPIIGAAVSTTALVRVQPFDNYDFLNFGAMGIEVRADFNGKSGVFASTIVN